MSTAQKKFDKDLKIARVLLAAPLATVKEVSQQAGIPTSTVQKRIRRLKEDGLLCYQLVPSNRDKLFATRAMISIDVEPDMEAQHYGYSSQEEFVCFLKYGLQNHRDFREYTRTILVESVDILLGGFCDVILIVAAADTLRLCDFVTRCLRRLPGVRKTNTATLIAARNRKSRLHIYQKRNHPRAVLNK